jgi:hypothetical protein
MLVAKFLVVFAMFNGGVVQISYRALCLVRLNGITFLTFRRKSFPRGIYKVRKSDNVTAFISVNFFHHNHSLKLFKGFIDIISLKYTYFLMMNYFFSAEFPYALKIDGRFCHILDQNYHKVKVENPCLVEVCPLGVGTPITFLLDKTPPCQLPKNLTFTTCKNAVMINVSEEARRMNDMMKMYRLSAGEMAMPDMPDDMTLVVNSANSLVARVKALIGAGEAEKAESIARQMYSLALLSQRPLTADELKNFLAQSYSVLEKL